MIPQKPVDVFDVTGAGDTFLAVLSVCILNNLSIQDACFVANSACSLAVQQVGCASLSWDVILENLYPMGSLTPVLELPQLSSKLLDLDTTIVFTNGCFDVLHAGHVDYLLKASSLGDVLVVAVNSDSSISRLKGSSRPINSLDKRLLVLSALKFIDYLIVFEDETPLHIIQSIKPDVLVKGGDYNVEDIVGYNDVIGYGGSVTTIPINYEISTTSILSAMS